MEIRTQHSNEWNRDEQSNLRAFGGARDLAQSEALALPHVTIHSLPTRLSRRRNRLVLTHSNPMPRVNTRSRHNAIMLSGHGVRLYLHNSQHRGGRHRQI